MFQYTGETSPDAVGGQLDQFLDRLQHLILPTLTLALGAIAGYSRYQRNAMLDVLGQDFIRTARAKGLTRRRALFKHGLRTALIPMATLFAYGVSGLVTGAVFVEKIFGWHGMGEWVVQGINNQDTNIVAAFTVFSGATILLGRTAVRRHLCGARSRGCGCHDQAGHRRPRRPSARRARSPPGAPWCCAGSCATGRRWSRSSLLVLLFIGCYALPPLLPYRYTDLDFHALLQPLPPSIGSAPTRWARTCWPRPCAACRSPC